MPNIKSAKKRVRVTAVKTMRNKKIKSNLKSTLKKADVAINDNAENKAEVANLALKTIDKAYSKGIMHKNKAARKKSQVARKLNASI